MACGGEVSAPNNQKGADTEVCPYMDASPLPRAGEGEEGEGLAPRAEVEQHNQQVGVVHDVVAVHIALTARVAEVEQHNQQVGVVHTAVAVHIALRTYPRNHAHIGECSCSAGYWLVRLLAFKVASARYWLPCGMTSATYLTPL
jgi:hypothetical protein